MMPSRRGSRTGVRIMRTHVRDARTDEELERAAIQPGAGAKPSTCPSRLATCLNSAGGKLPSFLASDASMVAIFAVRITEGTGRPAAARLFTGTAPGQGRVSGVVVMTT